MKYTKQHLRYNTRSVWFSGELDYANFHCIVCERKILYTWHMRNTHFIQTDLGLYHAICSDRCEQLFKLTPDSYEQIPDFQKPSI